MERIASRQNPLVRRFRELARATDSSGAVLLDGAHLLEEALQSHVPVDVVAFADRATTPTQRRSQKRHDAPAPACSRRRPACSRR